MFNLIWAALAGIFALLFIYAPWLAIPLYVVFGFGFYWAFLANYRSK